MNMNWEEMTRENAIEFLLQMGEYFRKQATNSQEDKEYWASLVNEERCYEIADLIRLKVK